MTDSNLLFILVDDDPINNLLSKRAISKNLVGAKVIDFLAPEMALNYIENDFGLHSFEERIIILLDINMPTLTGWDFLDLFNKFATSHKDKFSIYILSSSVDPSDIQRAKLNPLVHDFIEKPLNKEFLLKTFTK